MNFNSMYCSQFETRSLQVQTSLNMAGIGNFVFLLMAAKIHAISLKMIQMDQIETWGPNFEHELFFRAASLFRCADICSQTLMCGHRLESGEQGEIASSLLV